MADHRGQVIFNAIAKTYPTDAHIECSYTLKPTHIYSAYDWIGLYKVGWSSVKDHLFYIWVPSPKDRVDGADIDGSVLFQAGQLPKDDGEFYQFIYINESGKMCGASSPFQFRAPRSEDFIAEDMLDDEDMVFITTKHVKLEEQMNKLETEQERLLQNCEVLTDENTELKCELESVRNEMIEVEGEKTRLISELQKVKSENEEQIEQLNAQLIEINQKYEELILQVEELEAKNRASENVLVEKERNVAHLKNELDTCAGQVEALKREKELYHTHSSTAEAAKQQAVTELASLQRKYDANASNKEVMDTLQAQLTSAQETIDALERTKAQQKEIIDDQHDKLQATEARHVVDAEEISTLTETLANLSAKVEEVQTENYEVKTKYNKSKQKYDSERKDWDLTLNRMAKEKNGLLSTIGELNHRIEKVNKERVSANAYDEQEDRYIALQAAYALLKDELRETQKEQIVLKRREAKMKDADRQVKELQERLRKGEEERKKRNDQKQLHSPPSTAGAEGGDFTTKAAPTLVTNKDDLTKDELRKMVEQLSSELELRTLKKDKYKNKYLDEKQRSATLRDYYKGEMEKQTRDLELARAQLDNKLFSTTAVKPIIYPPVPNKSLAASDRTGAAAKKPADLTRQLSDTVKSKGALEQSILEDPTNEPLKPLPAPIEPLRVSVTSVKENTVSSDSVNPNGGKHMPSPIVYPTTNDDAPIEPRRRTREEIVVTRSEESDDDNEGVDRFHDASDMPTSMMKCCVCDKIFDSTETEEMRNAHVNEHLESLPGTTDRISSIQNHICPMCQKPFPKSSMSEADFLTHVNSHFTATTD